MLLALLSTFSALILLPSHDNQPRTGTLPADPHGMISFHELNVPSRSIQISGYFAVGVTLTRRIS